MKNLNIFEILSNVKTIALVGASPNIKRPSNIVMKYLQLKGYKVIPVNPNEKGKFINIELCFSSLKEIDEKIDMVDVFRKSEECYELAKDTIKINANVFWMQLGIYNKDAFKLILQNNKICIFNKCPKIEYEKNLTD